MLKKWIYYFSSALIVAFLSLSFKSEKGSGKNENSLSNNDNFHLLSITKKHTNSSVFYSFLTEKTFTRFKEAVAFKESQGQYKLVNALGYMGKYQFGDCALEAIGINNPVTFLNSPKLQELAFEVLLAKNKWELKDEITWYNGKIINGVCITESGILAAAHLGGASSVKKYLHSDGKRLFTDGFGTNLSSYLKVFGGYDTSCIVANCNAKV